MAWVRWNVRYLMVPCSLILLSFFFILINFTPVRYGIEDSKKIRNSSTIDLRPLMSTCSEKADQRGPHQKIISYSLYGDFNKISEVRRYFEPLSKTVRQVSSIYPGWIVRIHHNFTSDDEKLLDTFDAYENVDICNTTDIIQDPFKFNSNLFAKTWRWIPLLDDLVDIVLSRDSDSLIIERELLAVTEWIESDNAFHLMRDHPFHCNIPMLGGLWGVKLNHSNGGDIRKAAKKIFMFEHEHTYDFDQKILETYFWPLAKRDAVAHDSYCCEYLNSTKAFPSERIGEEFVGMLGKPGGTYDMLFESISKCPEKCRKLYQWSYC